MSRVGIHRANFADFYIGFAKLLFTVASLCWVYPQTLSCEIFLIYFWPEIGLCLVCLTVVKNAGMAKNYRFMKDYENQEKK
jgi:hypothetical protein